MPIQPTANEINCVACGAPAFSYWKDSKTGKWYPNCGKKICKDIIWKILPDYMKFSDPSLNWNAKETVKVDESWKSQFKTKYNEIGISADDEKPNTVLGDEERIKNFCTKLCPMGSPGAKIVERLNRVAPGKKYLIFSLKTGEFVTEARDRNEAEYYCNEDRLMIYRG